MLIESFPVIAENLDVVALVALGWFVEKKFVSRPAIWANVAAINVHLYEYRFVEWWLSWYADIGIVFAVVALVSYATDESLPEEYYTFAWAYSSIPVAILVFLTWAGYI